MQSERTRIPSREVRRNTLPPRKTQRGRDHPRLQAAEPAQSEVHPNSQGHPSSLDLLKAATAATSKDSRAVC